MSTRRQPGSSTYPEGRACGDATTVRTLANPEVTRKSFDCSMYCCMKALWKLQQAVVKVEAQAGLPFLRQGYDYDFENEELVGTEPEQHEASVAILEARIARDVARQEHLDNCVPRIRAEEGYTTAMRILNRGVPNASMPPNRPVPESDLRSRLIMNPDIMDIVGSSAGTFQANVRSPPTTVRRPAIPQVRVEQPNQVQPQANDPGVGRAPPHDSDSEESLRISR